MKFDISQFRGLPVIVVGDMMIDHYIFGRTTRISPEAPVPIIDVEGEDFRLGGAGNVLNNLLSLGAEVFPAGAAGKGTNGRRLISLFNKFGVDTSGIVKTENRITSIKTRIIAENQQILRIDKETKIGLLDYEHKKIFNFIKDKISKACMIIISDYGKGVVTKELVAELAAQASKSGKYIIADPKGKDFKKYLELDLITPNQKEAALASGIDIIDEQSLKKAGQKIIKTAKIKNLLITCGKDGMTLFEEGQNPYKIEAKARQVFDVSGAGDTVIAVLGLCLGLGFSMRKSAKIANTAAGIVVGKLGTATVSVSELDTAVKQRIRKT